MKTKKAQSSIELVILTAFLLFAFLAFFFILEQKSSDREYEKKNVLVNNVIYNVEEEINLAISSDEGYYREFIVPEKIGDSEYNISIIDDLLYIKTLDQRFSSALKIPKVSGQIVRGKNIISKKEGEIYLNE